jgi:tRNA threonylcarbamoyladenosine biosynthesis protein TsaE
MRMNVYQFTSPSPEALRESGRRLGALLQPGDAVAFEGPMGAGKTTLIQGIAIGLGVDEDVTSPTFALMNVYRGRVPVYHLDVYRLDDPKRFALLGYEAEQAEMSVTLVEWADKWWPFWDDDVLRISLAVEGEGRALLAEALGPRSAHRLEAWRKSL